MSDYDAAVVGSGPNGLVAAVLLARAGRRVLLVEQADAFGGGLRSAELTLPGRVHDLCATVMAMTALSPAFRELGLGVEPACPEIPAAHPLDDRPAVLVHRDPGETAERLGPDAGAWRATVGATASGGLPLLDMLLSPLGVPGAGPGRFRPHLSAPLRAALFGRYGMLPATTLARTRFRTVEGRAVLAGMAAHSIVDLRLPMTAGYGLMLAATAHLTGWPLVRGGSQRLADALVAELLRLGGEAVTGHRVTTVKELDADTIVLDAAPWQFAADFPAGYVRRLRAFRRGPGVFKLDWALDGPVPWRDPAVARAGTVHVGGTLEEVALSEAEMFAGRHSPRPFVLLVQPYAADPTRGGHTLWGYCHVPNGSAVDMTEAVEAQIERFAPGFRDRVLARHAMTTADLERRNPNYAGGDIAGGLSTLGQFLKRPVWSLNPWRTPLPNVFLCSSSTPPGAGVHGMGGWHAARLALAADSRRSG
ncbi:phytoene desaturase family protein [Thermoactinospora rubra]|uniref:phytoene desaturase family protein n=1 Tax=Thermoactinospora rubra TaxID=1088767 RepID=UPI000A10E334|nr:NAD(P)/FAD-dependent oxidoreductase [Thermoactinospora rubra]